MQEEETETDVSNCNNRQNKLENILALAYNNCVANIKSYVELTNKVDFMINSLNLS